MLVLTRRVGEAITIGDHIAVTVLEKTGSFVRLGVQAPKSYAVHRLEVLERIRAERAERANSKEV